MTIQEKAQLALDNLTTSTRDDGTVYVHRVHDSPDWVQELCIAAHDDMSPDDYRYQFITEALEALRDLDDDADPYEADVTPDEYTSALTNWLHSRADRVYYLTEALEQGGHRDGFLLLADAQYAEMREVLILIIQFLENLELDDPETEQLDLDTYRKRFYAEADAEGVELEEAESYIVTAWGDGLSPAQAARDYPDDDGQLHEFLVNKAMQEVDEDAYIALTGLNFDGEPA